MSKTVLGLDLGSNSVGWALLEADAEGKLTAIRDAGVRIFPKAVEEQTPTPKNQQRRTSRLARRTIQRRARRKRKLLNYLISLNLLPKELLETTRPEGILNSLGDPYQLRAKALDQPLSSHELGRVLLHLVQRRGFLSNKKTRLGRDMLDDPDVLAVLGDEETDDESSNAEETAFKADINQLRKHITDGGYRTLGEYLAARSTHDCKRNRGGQHLRTDRRMYQDELNAIFAAQETHHSILNDEVKEKIGHIIFHQRPLKLRKDRVGKCSLEPTRKRAAIARLEYQRFRYLQDINNLEYFDPYSETWCRLSDDDREKLSVLFEKQPGLTFTKIRKALGLEKHHEFNLDSGIKKLRGNTTACAIRDAYPNWDDLNAAQQQALVEDLVSIKKKSALKTRLQNHWKLDGEQAVRLCMVELEPDYGKVSMKAIRKLLPHLQVGKIYSDARVAAGYGYEPKEQQVQDRLGPPPELPNPIVNKALHELKRVVNALVAEYGKPDVIRIEMARDLEMNTQKYKDFEKQQQANTKANDEAVKLFQSEARKNPGLTRQKYPSRDQKIRYRLWEDQNRCCAYSNRHINCATLFSADVEIDHIIPFSLSLNDSYMNKVLCFAKENQFKGQKTPVEAFGGNEEKWVQITQAIGRWPKGLSGKRDRFYQRHDDLDADFVGNQLTDTRYIAKEAGAYLKSLGVEVTYTRGQMTAWLRKQWQLNDLIGETDRKERTDHRHHAIDAVVTACIDRRLYNTLVKLYKEIENTPSGLSMNDVDISPDILDIKEQLREKLQQIIVSQVPQRKISGALHEETGVGYVEKAGGTVYRKWLTPDFKVKDADKIIDDTVKELVRRHLSEHDNDSKMAFKEGFKLCHKDGKTLIKRVRVLQSKTSLEDLAENKFPIRNSEGEAFKWYAYGNTHHVEILKHKTRADTYKGCFVTAMEASQRVRKRKGERQQMYQKDHGPDWEFVMALHINDLVNISVDGAEEIYRVQKLQMISKQVTLRLHTAATIDNKNEGITKTVNPLMKNHNMRLISVNAIGKLSHH